MRNFFYKILPVIIIGVNTLPSSSMAAVTAKLDSGSNLSSVIDFVLAYFNEAIFLIIGLCVLTFVWGVYKYYFVKNDSPDARAEGGKFVLFALVGFFVILSLWGLVAILRNTFGIGSNSAPTITSSGGGSVGGSNGGIFSGVNNGSGGGTASGANNGTGGGAFSGFGVNYNNSGGGQTTDNTGFGTFVGGNTTFGGNKEPAKSGTTPAPVPNNDPGEGIGGDAYEDTGGYDPNSD